MSEISNYLSSQILNWIKGTAFATEPASVYVALYSSDPGDDGTGGTDVTATIRAAGRVAVTFGTIASKAMSNDAIVDFGAADAGASVTHFGIWTDASAGNFIGGSAVDTPRTVLTADPVSFPIGTLSISF